MSKIGQSIKITQSEPATIYKRMISTKKSQRTRRAYADDLISFSTFLGIEVGAHKHPLESVPDSAWRELDTTHVVAYLEHLKTMDSPFPGRPYSTATIVRRMTAVLEFLTEATWQGFFDRDQLEYLRKRIDKPEVTHEHHSGITPDEQARVLEVAGDLPGLKGLRDYALLRLWLGTGVRREEMAALEVRDLVVKDGIPKLIVRQGKGNKLREIGLEPYTEKVLRDWLSESSQVKHPDWAMFCQVCKSGRGDTAKYIVVDPQNHLSGTALYKLVLWYAAKAGVKSKISPHSFRVAMVTDSRDGGADMHHVQSVGGWTTSRMPEQVYDRRKHREPISQYRKLKFPKRKGRPQSSSDLS